MEQINNNAPTWAKELMDENKSLREKVQTIEDRHSLESRKAALTKAMENAPKAVKERFQKDLERMNFKDEDDFNGWLGDVTADMNVQSGIVTKPKSGAGSGNSSGSSTMIQAALKERVEEKGMFRNAIFGMPDVDKSASLKAVK